MDSDFWASRIAAAKRQYTFQQQQQRNDDDHHHHRTNHHGHHNYHLHYQSSHLDRMSVDDFEMEEDQVKPDFPCPYCYEDFDIASLISHLEDEHSCESSVTVCPICSVKVASDLLSHITLQHGQLFKLQRRHRLSLVAVPNSQMLSLLGRDLREAHLQVLLGGSGYRSSNANLSNVATTDPLLSSLILNFPASEVEELSKSMLITSADDTSSKNPVPTNMWKSSFDCSLSHEEREKRMRQAAGRAGFMQDLLLTTLLSD